MVPEVNHVTPPDELKLTGSVHVNWKIFRQSFEFYLLPIGIDEDDEPHKIAPLLTLADQSALDVHVYSKQVRFIEVEYKKRESIESFVTDLSQE